MKTFIVILFSIPLLYLALSACYQLVLALASKFKGASSKAFNSEFANFLVLVPAYKEDEIIKYSTIKNLNLKYEYPREKFDYVVIADQLQSTTVKQLKNAGAKVHEVSFEESTKVKSLKSAIAKFNKGYDAVVILDADNLLEKGFLNKANLLIQGGLRAIQGLRKAANQNTNTALMDGLSEAANTEILCKGANRLGFSSKLSGSAMVFDFRLFKDTINQCKAIGGFDKEMELLLTAKGEYIHYASDLAVLDQKVTSSEAFARQRGRWLEAQYSFLKRSFKSSLKELAKGNIDYFHKVMQLALPPRAIAPFAIILIAAVGALVTSKILVYTALFSLVALMASYLIVLPIQALGRQFFKITLSVPSILIAAIKALTKIQQSKRTFIHTKHELIEG